MKKFVLVFTLALFAVFIAACAEARNQAPELNGVNINPTVELGDDYDPLDGVTAKDKEDGDIPKENIQVRGFDPEDLNSLGSIQFTITVKDSDDEETSITINLSIVAGHPTMSGVNLLPEIFEGDSYNPLEGVVANDPQDGNIASSLVAVGYDDNFRNTAGTYTFVIRATDSDGKTVENTVVLTVSVRPEQDPTFSGVNRNQTITEGDAWNPLTGVTASDPQDGDITSSIVVSNWNAANVDVPGTYVVTLTVEDSDDNEITTTITLVVEPGEVSIPVFSGVQVVQNYYIGSGEWSPLDGVTASDLIDGDITDQITFTPTFLLDSPGVYTVTLRVTNSTGQRTTVNITLNVLVSAIPLQLTTDPISIDFWHAMGEANQALVQGYADDFRDYYSSLGFDFTVNIPAGVGNYDILKDNMINAITAGDVPNIVQTYPDHVAEYLNSKSVLSLDPYITSPEWGLSGADAFEDIIEQYRIENSQYDASGTYYSLPFNKSTEVMIYNKTAYDALELDYPETWQDIIAHAPLLKAYGDAIAEAKVRALPANASLSEAQLAPLIAAAKMLVVPASYDSISNMFITFTRQFNGAYTGINPTTFKGEYLWVGNENTLNAMTFLHTNKAILTIPEYWGQDFASIPFVNQQTFVTIGSSAGIRYNIPATDPTTGDPIFELGVAPVPYNADMPEHKAVIQQGTNLSILKTGTAQEQLVTWLFLKWLIKTENTVDLAVKTGYLPVRTSGNLHPDYQSFLTNPSANALPISMAANAAYLQLGYMFYDPAFVGSSRARQEVGVAITRILTGDGNITEALQDAYNEVTLGLA
jgi:ABC-type glycerol-3-phosphate transport system substrate-binding protein